MPELDAQINFNIEPEAKEAAKEKLEYGELSEVLRQHVRKIAFGEEVSEREQVKQRLQELRDKKDQVRSERRQQNARLEDIEQEEARLEERLQGLESRDAKYEGQLEMLEAALAEGQRIDPGRSDVKRAALTGKTDPRGVIQELMERNPEVPDYAFSDGLHDNKKWYGFSKND